MENNNISGQELADLENLGNVACNFFDNVTSLIEKPFELQKQKYENEREFIKGQLVAYQEREASIRHETEWRAKTEMASIEANKEIKIREMKEETVRIRIMEQSKCLQKAMDISYAAFNRKLDFYQKQLENCNEFFSQQIQTLQNEIFALKSKRDQFFNDTETYNLLSNQIHREEKMCKQLIRRWEEFQGKLTEAVQLAQLDCPVNDGLKQFIAIENFNSHRN